MKSLYSSWWFFTIRFYNWVYYSWKRYFISVILLIIVIKWIINRSFSINKIFTSFLWM